MKYKELIIGAVLSLLVTLAGITATYYINKTSNNSNLDKLSYTVNQTTAFSSESQDLAITSITIQNNGDRPAKQAFISIHFDNAEIRDTAIKSKTSIKYASKVAQKNLLELTYDSLLPEDSITIELLLSNSEKPTINLRSTNAIGQESSPSAKKEESGFGKLVSWLPSALLITAIVYIVAVFFSKKAQTHTFKPSKNNSAFILIHNNFIEEAGHILSDAINDGDYSSYAFSNFALYKSLSGENEIALALLECAKYTPAGNHSIAVNHFNESIILFRNNDKKLSLESLKKALKLSPKEIFKYYTKSKHTENMKADNEYASLVAEVDDKYKKNN